MTRHARLLVLFSLAAALGGCAPRPDADQVRLCRLAFVALADRDATLTIESQTPVAAAPGDTAVRILASQHGVDGGTQTRTLECRFASGGDPLATLRGVRLDRDSLSGPALFFLKRFWLATQDADAADPQPVLVSRAAPAVPLAVAHGLQAGVAALPGIAIYGLLAAAYALVYGLIGRLNLAFGATAAVGGAASLAGLGLMGSTTMAGMVAVAIVAALWAGALHGFAIARWVFLPLGRATGQQGLVATVGLAFVLEEYLRIAQGPTSPWVTPLRAAPMGIAVADGFVVTLTPLSLAVTATFAAGAALLLALMRGTQFGRNWRAMADDPAAAALLGVDPARLLSVTVALASALAAAAGAITVLIYGNFGAAFGAILGLKALLAAVVGGIGSVPGALLGALTIAVAEAAWSVFFPIEYRDLALFIALSGLLIARPGGLLGFGDLAPRRV